jgi:hypothetical protein
MSNIKFGAGIGAALLAGAAGYAFYKYTKMSAEQKRNLVDGLKEKGKKFYDDNIPSGLKNIFARKEAQMNGYTHS